MAAASAASIRPFAAAIASSSGTRDLSARRPGPALVNASVSRPRASWARHHSTHRSSWPKNMYAPPNPALDAVGHLVAAIGENRLGGVAVADSGLGPSGHPAQRRHYTSGAGDKSRRLSFKGLGTKVATSMLGPDGQKALAPSGATIVGQEFVRDPSPLVNVLVDSLVDALLGQAARLDRVRLFAPDDAHIERRRGGRGGDKADVDLQRHPHRGRPGGRRPSLRGDPAFPGRRTTPRWRRSSRTLCSTACRWRWRPRCSQMSTAPAGFRPKRTAPSVLTTLRKGLTKLEVSGYTASSIVRYRCAHFDS